MSDNKRKSTGKTGSRRTAAGSRGQAGRKRGQAAPAAARPKAAAQKKASVKKPSPKTAPAKKTPTKKTPAIKTPATKAPASKTSAKKPPAKKSTAKQPPAKKSAAKKRAAKPAAATKTAVKKATVKTSPLKTSPVKKTTLPAKPVPRVKVAASKPQPEASVRSVDESRSSSLSAVAGLPKREPAAAPATASSAVPTAAPIEPEPPTAEPAGAEGDGVESRPASRIQLELDGTTLEIIEGDITEVEVEALVNPANENLQLGTGVAGAVLAKGGPSIQEECDRIGHCAVGTAVMTGAGRLKVKQVIHAVGPRWGEGDEDRKLSSAVRSAMALADRNGLRSVALPAISTGNFGFPLERAARIMLTEIHRYLQGGTKLHRVVLCLYGEEAFNAFRRELRRGFR